MFRNIKHNLPRLSRGILHQTDEKKRRKSREIPGYGNYLRPKATLELRVNGAIQAPEGRAMPRRTAPGPLSFPHRKGAAAVGVHDFSYTAHIQPRTYILWMPAFRSPRSAYLSDSIDHVPPAGEEKLLREIGYPPEDKKCHRIRVRHRGVVASRYRCVAAQFKGC